MLIYCQCFRCHTQETIAKPSVMKLCSCFLLRVLWVWVLHLGLWFIWSFFFFIWCKVTIRNVSIIITQDILASLSRILIKMVYWIRIPEWEGILAIQAGLWAQCKENYGSGKARFGFLPTSFMTALCALITQGLSCTMYFQMPLSSEFNQTPSKVCPGKRAGLWKAPVLCQRWRWVISFPSPWKLVFTSAPGKTPSALIRGIQRVRTFQVHLFLQPLVYLFLCCFF